MVSATTSGFGAAAIDALGRMLDESRPEALAPAVVVCTTQLVSVGVRRSLGRRPGGIAGIQFTTLESLALDLSGLAMVGSGAHLSSEVEVQAAIRAELAANPGLFGRVAGHHTTEERLVGLHRQVGGVNDQTLARLQAAGDGLAGDTIRVLRGAMGRMGQAWTHDRLLEATLDELAHLAPGARGPIMIYLPEPDGPFEGPLLSALARRPACHLLVGLTGDPLVDRRHVGRLAGWSVQVEGPRPSLNQAKRLEVADPDDEVRAALRAISAHATLGIPLSQLAILYPTADPYATLLAEQLDGAGLPWCGPGHRTLANSLAGRFLLRLLRLAITGFERSAVLTVASSAPLDHEGEPLPVSLWDRLSRQAGVIDGDHWEPRLVALDGLGPADQAGVKSLLGFIANLRRLLAPEPEPTTWMGWVSWMEGLLEVLGSDDEWPPEERQARTQLSSELQELRLLDAHGDQPDLATVESIVGSQLERLHLPGSAFGTGLLVAPISAVPGLDLERVVIVGLAEGTFPRTPRDDALLPDRVRAESRGLIGANESATDLDVRAVAAALAGTRQVPLIITSRGDLRSIRSRSWPRLLESLAEPPTIIESHHEALADHGRPASAADLGLRALLTHVDGGDPVHTHELAHRDPVLATNLRRVLDRQRPELTRHVGRVPAGALDPTERLLSATALEAYASCPRSYLLGRVLRLGDDDRPERIEEITPADRGKLLHAVLECFIAASLDEGTVPAPSEPWPASARQALLQVLDDEVTAAQARGITGGRVSTMILHRRLTTEMDLFIETDNALRAERRSTPVQVELGFGFDDDPSELSLPDGRTLRLRGRVDRVDATDDGGVLVIDYKGGSGRAFSTMAADPLDRGRRLQLPLYARVVADKLGRTGPRTALYWLTRNGEVRPMELEEELESDLDQTVTAALDGISGGLFPGVPGEAIGWPRLTFENCRYCEFDRICPTDRQREWDTVRHDPLLEPIALLLDGSADGTGDQ
ncbi:MAG: hypothetical protein GY773_32940 [Actinomycetia bacterium]|nr:hypothetical protein [Actinomycetes bacterium]